MTKKEVLKDFFKKTIAPVISFILLFVIAKSMFGATEDANFYALVFCGIPYGIRRMFLWIVPHGYDLGGTLGIITLNFIVGGIIGVFVLAWKLLVAIWYVPLTIYRLLSA